MTNQIAIKLHTQPGEQVMCDQLSHIYHYEGGGIAFNSGVTARLLEGDRGRLSANQVVANINPDDVHFPPSRLVSIENTCNKAGGTYYGLAAMRAISETCRHHGLRLHLDGARLFNALAESGDAPSAIGPLMDTVSICLSKGLGAPVGSLLLGDTEHIRQARRIRKVLGGGMRQAGILAAAGIYALDHHIDRLPEDHARARELGAAVAKLPYVKEVLDVETNIVVFTLNDDLAQSAYLAALEDRNLKAVPFGPQRIRLVTHLDFGDDALEKTIRILGAIA